MRRSLRFLACLILALIPQPALADVRLTDDPAASTDPFVCSLKSGGGDLSVVWVDGRDAGVDRIYLARVSATGTKLTLDLPVSDGIAPASEPSCAVDGAGNTHVVWLQGGALLYAKHAAAGSVQVAPFVRKAAPVEQPRIDVEPGGNAHIAWVDAGSPRRVMYQALDSVGGNFGSCAEQVYDVADTGITTEHPFVLAPGSGNTYAFVSWHGDTTEFDDITDVTVAFPNCNGINGPFFQTNDIAVGRTAMTEFDAAENAFLIFEGRTDTPLQHVYWLQGAGSYVPIDEGIGPAFHPSLAALSDTQLYTVWEDRRYGRPWIFGQAWNGTAGTPTGGNCPLSDGLSAARRPSLARAGVAEFAIAWDDDRHGETEIYLKFAGSGCLGMEVVDPNPDLVASGAVVSDSTELADEGRLVSGLVADGITPLLLRLPVAGPGSVTFEIEDESGGTADIGSLSSPGGNEGVLSLPRPTQNVAGQDWAFAVLRAPDRFVRGPADEPLGSRPILVRATFTPDVGTPVVEERTIELRRPPVLLLHGLWGRAAG